MPSTSGRAKQLFVFVGPSLRTTEAEHVLDATYLPPAAQGDICRVARARPFAIGLIDGYFEKVPAVWHKEILWALAQGIHVLGAASMGALRAAELSRFGMIGVGSIFADFSSGRLEDDDEVAVAHGDASTGYRSVSEAMVNIRATLRRAVTNGGLSAELAKAFEDIAKEAFYPDRCYPLLLARLSQRGVPESDLKQLAAALQSHAVNQKRQDALELLAELRRLSEAGTAPEPVRFSFSKTEAWSHLLDETARLSPVGREQHAGVSSDAIAAEVRMTGESATALLAKSWKRLLGKSLSWRDGVRASEAELEALDTHVRARLQLENDDQLREWMLENDLDDNAYRNLLEGQGAVERVHRRWYLDNQSLIDESRLAGAYTVARQRARQKQQLLQQNGLDEPTLEALGVDATRLVTWYFEERLRMPVPRAIDTYLLEQGLHSLEDLLREARREYAFLRLTADAGE